MKKYEYILLLFYWPRLVWHLRQITGGLHQTIVYSGLIVFHWHPKVVNSGLITGYFFQQAAGLLPVLYGGRQKLCFGHVSILLPACK